MKERIITIGVKELTFLAALLDGQTLLGVADPFDGWLAHQVEEEWAKLYPEMEARELVNRDENGRVLVNESIAGIIKTCCFPEGCVLLSRWEENGNNNSMCYYLTKEMQVEKEDETSPETCKLTIIENSSEIPSLMKKSFHMKKLNGSETGGGELPSSLIESIRANKEEHKKLVNQIQEKYPTFSEPDKLIDAIVNPLSYSILVYSDFRKEPVSSYGFSVLESQDCAWKLRSFNKNDEEWLEIKPLNKEGFDQELSKVSKRINEIIEGK